jgi:hypothetical protein
MTAEMISVPVTPATSCASREHILTSKNTADALLLIPLQFSVCSYTKAGIGSEVVTPAVTVGQMLSQAVAKRGKMNALRIEAGLPPVKGKEVRGPSS